MEQEIVFTTDRCVIDGDSLWFVNISGEMICKVSTKSWKTEIVARIPKKHRSFGDYNYSCAAVYQNRVILYPEFENKILDYDLDKRSFVTSEIECLELDDNTIGGNTVKFRNAFLCGDKLYLMPQSCHKIVEYDLERKEHKTYSDWYDNFFSKYGWKDVTIFRSSLENDGSLWFLCGKTNALMQFVLETKESFLYHIGDESSGFSAFSKYKDNEFAIWDSVNKQIVFWDIGKKQMSESSRIDLSKISDDVNKYSFYAMYAGTNIMLAPNLGERIIMIDDNDKDIDISHVEVTKKDAYISVSAIDNNKLLFVTQKGENNMLYDIMTKTWSKVCFEVNPEELPVDFGAQELTEEGRNKHSLYEFIGYVTREG